MIRVCKVDGCEKRAEKREMCGAHYFRWRKHGDPLGGRTPNGHHASFIAQIAKATAQECIVWPFPRNRYGYGIAHNNYAHRLVCEAAHGPPPNDEMEAAHSCGNGRFGCVNPNHLRWASHQDNMREAGSHGRMWKKLTIADVLAIRSLAGKIQDARLARRFGITQSSLKSIIEHKSWAWL